MPRSQNQQRRPSRPRAGKGDIVLSLNEFVSLTANAIGRLNEKVTRLETIVAAHELQLTRTRPKRETKG